MKILPHEMPRQSKTTRRKGVAAAARRYGVSPAALHSFLRRNAPDWPPEKAARELRRRQQQRARAPASRKLEALGMARNAVARFRRYHRGTPKAEWSDDKIIEHLAARRIARTTRAGLRISPNTIRYKKARARAEGNGIPGKLFRTRVNAHGWSLEDAATTPPGASPRQHMTAHERDQAVHLLAEGVKPKEVAAQLNVARRCVYWLNYRRKKRLRKEVQTS